MSTRAFRAFSLLEVMVVMAIFSFILVAFVSVETNSRNSLAKNEAENQAYRAAFLSLTKLKSKLLNAKLELEFNTVGMPDPLPLASYNLPVFVNQQIHLNEYGMADWEPEPYYVVLQEGKVLERHINRPDRILGDLGARGTIQIQALRYDLIQIDVHADIPVQGQSKNSVCNLTDSLVLNNQDG